MGVTQCIYSCRHDNTLKFTLSTRMGKKGRLNDFERGVIVRARWAGMNISKAADLLRFHTQTKYPERSSWNCQRKCQQRGYDSHRLAKRWQENYDAGSDWVWVSAATFRCLVKTTLNYRSAQACISYMRLLVEWGMRVWPTFDPSAPAEYRLNTVWWPCPSLSDYGAPIFWWRLPAGQQNSSFQVHSQSTGLHG